MPSSTTELDRHLFNLFIKNSSTRTSKRIMSTESLQYFSCIIFHRARRLFFIIVLKFRDTKLIEHTANEFDEYLHLKRLIIIRIFHLGQVFIRFSIFFVSATKRCRTK